jgi:hypothetical protein
MTKSLREICEDRRAEINDEYDLGPGDAEELFKMIWAEMMTVATATGPGLSRSMENVDEAFDI